MLETRQGAPDGVNRFTYEKGNTYDIPDHIARTFIQTGSARPAGAPPREKKITGPQETKPDAPETAKDDDAPIVTVEPTTKGSSYYQFRDPNGDLIVNGDGDVIKAHGRDDAEEMKEEIEKAIAPMFT